MQKAGEVRANGEYIAKRRIELGLTQEALANDSQVSRNIIASLEKNRRGTRTHNLHRLARALDSTYADLVASDLVETGE